MPQKPNELGKCVEKVEMQSLLDTIDSLISNSAEENLDLVTFTIGETVEIEFNGNNFKVSAYKLRELKTELELMTVQTYSNVEELIRKFEPLSDQNEAASLMRYLWNQNVEQANGNVKVYFLGRYFHFTEDDYTKHISKYIKPTRQIGKQQDILLVEVLKTFLEHQIKTGEQ